MPSSNKLQRDPEVELFQLVLEKKGDPFQPRRSRMAERAFDSLLRSDDDIWVERFYLNKRKQRVYFYRSFNTGKCVLSEPPSGARHIVRMRDLERAPPAVQRFAQEKLDRGSYSSKMERSLPTLYPSTFTKRSPGIESFFK